MISASFPEAEVDETTRSLRLQGYLIAVEGFSVGVLKAAAGKVIRGEVAGVDPRFMPTPPQLRRLCDETRGEMHRALNPPKPVMVLEHNVAANPVVAAKLAALSAELAATADMEREALRPLPSARQSKGEAA